MGGLSLDDSAKLELKDLNSGNVGPGEGRCSYLAGIRGSHGGCLVSRGEIFEEIRIKIPGMGPHALRYLRDAAFKSRGKSKSRSECYESQESCDDGSVSAFAKPRVGKGSEWFEVVGRLE